MKENQPMKDCGIPLVILEEILSKISAIEAHLHPNATSNTELRAGKKLPDLYWTASKTDLIELIYGLYSSKTFNHGKITIKAITHFFESALGMKLGNTSLRFQEILRRKESHAFLDQIRESLDVYITRIDESKLNK